MYIPVYMLKLVFVNADIIKVIPVKSSGETTCLAKLNEVMFEGITFNFRLEGNGPTHYFRVVMMLDDDTLMCQASNRTKLTTDIAGKSINSQFPTEEGSCAVKIRVLKQSSDGMFIAVAPIDKPAFRQQRQSFRLKPEENINFRIQFEGIGNIYRGVTIEDISKGGLGVLVRTSREIENGTKVRLFIELPKHDLITILGEVANSSRLDKSPRMFRIGIRFTGIDGKNLDTIADYIRAHANLSKLRSAKENVW